MCPSWRYSFMVKCVTPGPVATGLARAVLHRWGLGAPQEHNEEMRESVYFMFQMELNIPQNGNTLSLSRCSLEEEAFEEMDQTGGA
ncbi:hypothetical protein BTVI_80470 [Pitangus sulphuratus]|nr:hypothetical protein BTVI_80470 [Pitangus sulphuratus]